MEVKIKNLVKTFEGKKGAKTVAVNNMTFDIPDGKLCGLLGPSGCGKSTTLYMIAGIHTVTEGKVYFGNEDVTLVPPENRGIGLVFQNYALYPHLNVRQNIMFPLDNVTPKLSYDEKCAIALENAKIVNIEKLLDRKPKELSGGQQQRVAIARALAKRPRVLLLDEPLSNLDARLRLQTREEIKRIQKETGITTIFVTHDQEEAMSISDFIVVMKDGIIQQKDEPQKVYEEPANLFVAKFLGTPAINVFDGDIKNGTLYMAGKEIVTNPELKKVHVEEVVCPNCGNVVSHNGKYCNNCGTNIISGGDLAVSKKSKKASEQVERPVYGLEKSLPHIECEDKEVAKELKVLRKLVTKFDSQRIVDKRAELANKFIASSEELRVRKNEFINALNVERALEKIEEIVPSNEREKEVVEYFKNIISESKESYKKGGDVALFEQVERAKTGIKMIPYADKIYALYKDNDWEGSLKIKENQIKMLSGIKDTESPETVERVNKIISSLETRLNPERTCKVGIRAEHFTLDSNGPIEVKVFNIEHIGRDISVVGTVNGLAKSEIKIIISSELSKECEGKEILRFSPKRVYVFEETGERIL